ncbi:unnamed protein product, partial [Anisakis simplex]|uniref:G_PROTEIN_RECEP_F1_2 domain-containing protein n=1 Tax=Anisakis simplex TaxID=6269 RepID=A0A0M3K6C6_ANISI
MEFLPIATYIVKGPITCLIVVFGVSLNFMTLYTLFKSSKGRQRNASRARTDDLTPLKIRSRPTIHMYFFWIACTDSGLLVSALLMYSLPAMLDSTYECYVRLFPLYYMLSNMTLTASVWLMCAMMFDRYRALCRPLHETVWLRTSPNRRVHLTCLIVVLMALLYSSP